MEGTGISEREDELQNVPHLSETVLADISPIQIVISLSASTPPPVREEFNLTVRTPLKSVGSSIGILCRICHEYENPEDMIAPCECSGSMALVHQECLARWLSMSGRDFCEICGQNLSLAGQQEVQSIEVENEQWSLSPSWVTIILLFLFSIGLSLFYCIHMTDTNFEFWTAITLVSLNIIACVSICFHACYSPR